MRMITTSKDAASVEQMRRRTLRPMRQVLEFILPYGNYICKTVKLPEFQLAHHITDIAVTRDKASFPNLKCLSSSGKAVHRY